MAPTVFSLVALVLLLASTTCNSTTTTSLSPGANLMLHTHVPVKLLDHNTMTN